MAGQALCWQAAIIEMATHSSRQKPSQSAGEVFKTRWVCVLMARTQQESWPTAVFAAAAPMALE